MGQPGGARIREQGSVNQILAPLLVLEGPAPKMQAPALPPAESPSTINSSERAGSELLQRKNFLQSVVSINSPFFLLPARASSSTSWASFLAFCICKIFLSHSFPSIVLRSNHSFRPSSTPSPTTPPTA